VVVNSFAVLYKKKVLVRPPFICDGLLGVFLLRPLLCQSPDKTSESSGTCLATLIATLYYSSSSPLTFESRFEIIALNFIHIIFIIWVRFSIKDFLVAVC